MTPKLKKTIQKLYGKLAIFPDAFAVNRALYQGPSRIIQPIFQDKPWGGELWFFPGQYALKILFIEKGHRFSLQKHQFKSETWLVLKGYPLITINNKKIKAKPNQIIHIQPETVHRIEAVKGDLQILEVSSPELYDAVRISDDYDRLDKAYNTR